MRFFGFFCYFNLKICLYFGVPIVKLMRPYYCKPYSKIKTKIDISTLEVDFVL